MNETIETPPVKWTPKERAAVLAVLIAAGMSESHLSFSNKLGYPTVRYKSSYFYRHGRSPETVAQGIKAKLPTCYIVCASDNWNAWPKDSWFEVEFAVK